MSKKEVITVIDTRNLKDCLPSLPLETKKKKFSGGNRISAHNAISIFFGLSDRTFIPLPRFIRSCRPTLFCLLPSYFFDVTILSYTLKYISLTDLDRLCQFGF
jgi:hypothetical protein